MEIGALVIGIEDYVEPWYRQSQFKLQYAIEDANAFVRYLSTAWQDHTLHLHCLPNAKATEAEISAAVASLAEQSIDIFFVYLSGHGDKDTEGNGWFCLIDAVRGNPSLDGPSIDRIFSRVNARTSLLLLDCCYAEGVLSNSRFFSTLHETDARLFLCSSRADQQTWEDQAVKHGIFSNILLRGLSTVSPVASPSGLVDVEAALFPYLCVQVPLAVIAAKGQSQRQEPVKGGISSKPVLIPTVSASLLGRQLSTYDAVLLGTRRWLRRIAIAAVLAVITIQLAFYHLATGPTGEIELRPGLKATEPFNLFGTTDTGLTQADLVTQEEDRAGRFRPRLIRLANGEIWGISLHRQADGLKTWFDQVIPLLSRGARAEATVLATGRLPADYVAADPEREKPPFRAILQAALLSSNTPSAASKPFPFDYDLPSATDLDCAKSTANIRNFELTEPTSSVIAADLSWNAARAVLEPSRALDRALDASKIVAYRISQVDQKLKHYSAGKEAMALAAMLLSISKIKSSGGGVTPAYEMPASAPGSWCEPGFAIVRLFLGKEEESRDAAKVLASNVGASADTINDPIAEARSEAALAGLQVLARSREIPAETIDAVVRIVEPHEQGLDGEPGVSEWLRSIAPQQIFPSRDIEWLFSQLNQNAENFSPLTAFNILSRNAVHLDTEKQQVLAAWYTDHFAEHRTQSVFAEAAGYLGAVIPLTPAPISFLSERLVPEIYVSGRGRTRRGTLIIRSTDFDAGVGLGVIGQAKPLPVDVVDRLYRFAAARANLGDLHEVYEGLARQRSVAAEDLAASVMANLRASRGSNVKRQLEIAIAIPQILHQKAENRDHVLDALRQKWGEESEPDLRMAVAQVIVETNLRVASVALPMSTAEAGGTDN